MKIDRSSGESPRSGWACKQCELQHGGVLLGASSWKRCQATGRSSQEWACARSSQADYCATPSAKQATGEASGPGRDHYWRAGAPTGRMTAHPSKEQAKKVFAVDGRCLVIRERLESQPHGVQSTKRPRHRSQNSRIQRGHQAWELLVHCHRNNLQKTTPIPAPKHAQSPSCRRRHLLRSRIAGHFVSLDRSAY